MAFGPGLVIEMARLTYVNRTVQRHNGQHYVNGTAGTVHYAEKEGAWQ